MKKQNDVIYEIQFDTFTFEEIVVAATAVAKAISAIGLALNRVLGKVTNTVQTIHRDTRKTLADFDKLSKLGNWQTGTVTTETTREEITGLEQMVDKMVASLRGSLGEFVATVGEKLKEFTGWDAGGITLGLGKIITGVGAVQALLRGDMSMALWLGLANTAFTAAEDRMGTFIGVLTNVSKAFSGVGSISSRVWSGISAVWGGVGLWFSKMLFNPLEGGFKTTANVIIGIFNALMSAVTFATNGLGDIFNKMTFSVPDWVPGIGGKKFGFSIPSFLSPKIPFLAQGAVLPANKPFLAMVGDQRHGTNIEAPLSTISEAVSLVMDDHTNALLSGMEASVGIQREILEAVLGIRIGDETIAHASERYYRKMAMAGGRN
ncbi:MAG: hypothetical protein E7453_03445 [Ruminococcaceae bacterium]|nr:hypothetical protein [Oscillospiraceae bacterium]